MELNRSNVIFDSVEHTYTLNGAQLQGITGMIKKHLFADKYSNVPESILNKAKERGSRIHEECQTYDMLGVVESEEVNQYAKIQEKEQIKIIENEYIVSDNKNFASPIDIVATVKGELSLIDIKCTYTLDIDYLRWQLSIYKLLFETQNPNLKVAKLYGLHFKEGVKLVEIQPIQAEHIQSLLTAEIEGLSFTNPFTAVSTTEQDEKAQQLIKSLVEIKNHIDQAKEQEKFFKTQLELMMNELNADKWENDFFVISKKKDYTRTTFNSTKLKKDNPELAERYQTVSDIKGGISFKLKV